MATPIFNIDFNVYLALLTQSSTGAPTSVEVENNLGTMVLARTSTGVYTLTMTGAFTSNKTVVKLSSNGVNLFEWVRTSVDVITIKTRLLNASGGTSSLADGLLSGDVIEIRVFNN